jgi:hypothetical protein
MLVRTVSIVAASAAVLFLVSRNVSSRAKVTANGQRAGIPLAVLGNSDSHSYQDSLWFTVDSPERGGPNRARTLQWTEVLARLRPEEIDQGAWGIHGYGGRLSRVAGWIGIGLRTPQKQDFAFNFATAGARCAFLDGPLGQTSHLVRTLKKGSTAWERGAVVVRIGINDLGTQELLDRVARDGLDDEARAAVASCAQGVEESVKRIRASHGTVRVVLVGIADNANWPPNFDRWQSRSEMERLGEFHNLFDDALRRIASQHERVSFFDDRAWFRAHWGGRDTDGELQYRPVCVGNLMVTYTQGDDLSHAVLTDGHAGTILNALWARSLVDLLVAEGVEPLTAIEPSEIDVMVTGLQADAGQRGVTCRGHG